MRDRFLATVRNDLNDKNEIKSHNIAFDNNDNISDDNDWNNVKELADIDS